MADLDETDEHQFAEIIASLKHKPDIDLESFRGTLERLAWFYLEADKLGTKIARPFERRPQLKRLRGKLSAVSKALAEARDDPYINRALNAAARSISHSRVDFIPTEGGEEGFDKYSAGGEVVVAPAPIQELVSRLAWFCEVIEKAENNATDAGTSKADVALYDLILDVADLYKSVAADPHELSGWSADSDGEFWNFLQKIVRPLGIKKSNDALWKIYFRARSPEAGTK